MLNQQRAKEKRKMLGLFELRLPVLFLTDEFSEKEKDAERLGYAVKETEDDSESRSFTFYQIEGICPCNKYGNMDTHSQVYSGGEVFVVPMNYKKLELLIRETKKKLTDAANQESVKAGQG